MEDLTFAAIADAISRPGHRPTGHRLAVAEMPEPFVAPTFKRLDGQAGGLAEVVFIRASAAVGKTTIARALSATRQVPVLDMAKVPVSTGSLKALLMDLKNGQGPAEAFHRGALPVIVDALDEGRMLSNENGFFSFLETAAELLLENRSEVSRTKLILFGRPEAIQYAQLLFSEDITQSVLEVGFFEQDGARALIRAYADKAAKKDSPYFTHKEPSERLVSAYFDRIEAALGLASGELWANERGRGFAGYAPVLAAIGSLLPKIENFADAINRLNQSGTRDAWGVIESVLGEIITRERAKLADQLANQISASLPDEAYDAEEQLSLLLQYIQRQPLNGTGRVQLPPRDSAKYHELIQQWVPEHPFLRGMQFTNDVLASFVYVSAIVADRPLNDPREQLGGLSRQPFLWRSIAGKLSAESLIDGKYVGYILNSFWNDPLTESGSVALRPSAQDSAVIVTVATRGRHDVQFVALMPVALFGQIRDADIEVVGDLTFDGLGDSSSSTFFLSGQVNITASAIHVSAAQIKISGKVWLDASVLASSGQISLSIGNDAEFGWGDAIKDRYPFNRHHSTLSSLHATSINNSLEDLLAECTKRFTTGGTLTLNADFSPPENDFYTLWANRRFRREFPVLMSLLVKHGLAMSQPMSASGAAGKIRLRFETGWDVLTGAVTNPDKYPDYAAFSSEVRVALG